MASPLVDVGTGFTIAFGTSSWSAQITDVNFPDMSREALDVSHQGTAGGMTFIPADLYDAGEMSFDIHYNPDTVTPVGLAAETITITSPASAVWSFTGFATGYSGGFGLNQKGIGSVTIKVSDEVAITAGS